MKKKHLLSIAIMAEILLGNNKASAQGMAINTTGTSAEPSAILDVNSTTKGMLIPRMTTTERTIISAPAKGLLVCDTTIGAFYLNNGTASSPVWSEVGGMPAGTATGDMLYWDGGAWARVSAGSNGQVLTLISGIPTWVSLLFSNITASWAGHGTVSPTGITQIGNGGSQVYSITPDPGYSMYTYVDGIWVDPVTSYTFTSVSANHTISADFFWNLVIGDIFEGGRIAYILQPGDRDYDPTTTHGLIAAMSDQSTYVWWLNGTLIQTYQTNTAIGDGYMNTSIIDILQGSGTYAASICTHCTDGGYTDWFLPSKYELNKLYVNRYAIGGFNMTASYWSSSEVGASFAWAESFNYGTMGSSFKYAYLHVRAIRRF